MTKFCAKLLVKSLLAGWSRIEDCDWLYGKLSNLFLVKKKPFSLLAVEVEFDTKWCAQLDFLQLASK